jgi:hypothetical protein
MSEKTGYRMPADVVPEWNAIWREVLNLHGQWKLYIGLYGNPKHVGLMQETVPDVFGLIQTALRHEITMAHGRLLDPASPRVKGNMAPNMSLARLIETVKAHCPPDFQDRLAKMLEQVKTHCAPMLQWRNKRVGHSDLQTALSVDEVKLPDIEREEIERGLEMLGQLVNEIDLHFNDRTTTFEYPLMRGTGDDLMQLLQRALDADAEESIRKFGFDPRKQQ